MILVCDLVESPTWICSLYARNLSFFVALSILPARIRKKERNRWFVVVACRTVGGFPLDIAVEVDLSRARFLSASCPSVSDHSSCDLFQFSLKTRYSCNREYKQINEPNLRKAKVLRNSVNRLSE
ncbi:hypothetical protein J6590_078810 [Homalodisca vitripennis]|nr:hypothetical protein J6590_078810 [Homalodisca vitripennis]